MIDAVIEALRPRRNISKIVAGRIVDEKFGDIPRAQRMRIADDASFRLGKERVLAKAAGDEAALLALSERSPEARQSLYDLVGAERFAALRPKRYPRSCWKPPLERPSPPEQEADEVASRGP